MKKLSSALLAASLLLVPAALEAQEYDIPNTQTPPQTVVSPEPAEPAVVAEPVAEPVAVPAAEPVVEPVAEPAVQEVPEVQAAPEKKVKAKKVKEPKVKEKKEKSYGLFNHLGVGVTGGVMDGLGATVAVPLGGHFQLRANYSVGVPDQVYNLSYTVPDMGTHQVQGRTVDLKDIVVKGSIPTDLSACLDFFISKKGNFHITVGLNGFLAKNDYIQATADISKPLKQAFPEEQNLETLFIQFNDDETGASAEVATDHAGILHLDMKTKSALRPYFGIGWGRVCNIRNWLSMNLDLGVQKVDGISLVGYDSYGKEQHFTSGMFNHKDSVGGFEDLIDKAAAGELPYIKGFMPVIRLGIQIRLF